MKIINLSVVINTLNEEKNIIDCIKSVSDLANEIVVVDMNSEDKTVHIAKKMGAKIFNIRRYGYVEPARNFAISKAKGEWILILDADERINASLKTKLTKIVRDNKYDIVQIPRKNTIFNKWIKHTFWWPDYQTRLFKKGKVKWLDAIHSQPEVLGNVYLLSPEEGNAIEHVNTKWYKNADGIIDMIKTYAKHTDFENSILNSKDLTPTDLFKYMSGEFEFRFISNEGYKDNMHGFVLSKFMEFYRFAEIAYFWEKKGYPRMFDDTALKLAAESSLNNQLIEVLKLKLEIIEKSKFYKLWRLYCKYRDLIMKKN